MYTVGPVTSDEAPGHCAALREVTVSWPHSVEQPFPSPDDSYPEATGLTSSLKGSSPLGYGNGVDGHHTSWKLSMAGKRRGGHISMF